MGTNLPMAARTKRFDHTKMFIEKSGHGGSFKLENKSETSEKYIFLMVFVVLTNNYIIQNTKLE